MSRHEQLQLARDVMQGTAAAMRCAQDAVRDLGNAEAVASRSGYLRSLEELMPRAKRDCLAEVPWNGGRIWS